MNRTPLPFTQAAVARAFKGAKAAGVEVARVEIGKDGKISIVTKTGAEAEPAAPVDDEKNEWDGAE